MRMRRQMERRDFLGVPGLKHSSGAKARDLCAFRCTAEAVPFQNREQGLPEHSERGLLQNSEQDYFNRSSMFPVMAATPVGMA